MPQLTADEKVAEELSQHGLRATRQRVATLRLLRRMKTHPTSAELHARLLIEHKNMSQKTVYEILDALIGASLATRVTVPGDSQRYEANLEPHYHATCRVCSRLYDVPAPVDSPIPLVGGRGNAGLPKGFHVENVDVTIGGVCLSCRGKA